MQKLSKTFTVENANLDVCVYFVAFYVCDFILSPNNIPIIMAPYYQVARARS